MVDCQPWMWVAKTHPVCRAGTFSFTLVALITDLPIACAGTELSLRTPHVNVAPTAQLYCGADAGVWMVWNGRLHLPFFRKVEGGARPLSGRGPAGFGNFVWLSSVSFACCIR